MSDLDDDSIIASCDCLTKTPAIEHHKKGCKYRLIVERDNARLEIKRLRGALQNWDDNFCWRVSPDKDDNHTVQGQQIKRCLEVGRKALSPPALSKGFDETGLPYDSRLPPIPL